MATPRYKLLSEQIAEQIRNDIFKAGDKLPSVRNLSEQYQVSISTALACYRQLEDKGYIEVKPKSGYYVKSASRQSIEAPKIKQSMAMPHQVTTSQLIMEVMHDSSNANFISLAAAIPDSSFPIIHQLKKTFAQLVRSTPFMGIGYDSSKGHEALRRQVARRVASTGVHISPEEVVVTNGCQSAIVLCLKALCEPGDIVAVEAPTYYGLLQLIESLGLKAIEIPSDSETGISIGALQLALEQWPIKAVMTVSNFSNPLGSLIPDAHKKMLVELINHHEIALIEDDIYGDLGYHDERPSTIKAFDTQDRVLLCASVSKVLEPQLGVGWVIPGRYQHEVEYQRFLINSSHFRLPQLAVAEIFSRGSFDRHFKVARETYRMRRDRLFDLVAEYFPEDTRLSKPQGGFVAWLQMPDAIDTTELYLRARQHGILIAPGEIFSSNKQKYRHSLRLSYAPEWTRQREDAVRTLGMLAKDLLVQP